FDWLYDQCCVNQKFTHVVDKIGWNRLRSLLPIIESNRDHDERAALVCLLTAASVAFGRYTAVGDPQGGYFFLPAWRAWADWARQELERQRTESVEVWIDGRRFLSS